MSCGGTKISVRSCRTAANADQAADYRGDSSHMKPPWAKTQPEITGHCRCHKEDDRVAEQEGDAENEQWADTEEKYFVCQLADKGAQILCPERARREQTRDGTRNHQGEKIEMAISVPGLSVTDEPR